MSVAMITFSSRAAKTVAEPMNVVCEIRRISSDDEGRTGK